MCIKTCKGLTNDFTLTRFAFDVRQKFESVSRESNRSRTHLLNSSSPSMLLVPDLCFFLFDLRPGFYALKILGHKSKGPGKAKSGTYSRDLELG